MDDICKRGFVTAGAYPSVEEAVYSNRPGQGKQSVSFKGGRERGGREGGREEGEGGRERERERERGGGGGGEREGERERETHYTLLVACTIYLTPSRLFP